MKRINNKTLGLICLILGGVFFVGGIVLFILNNAVNLYAQKTEATIVSKYAIESEEGNRTMLELAYRVGSEMVNTTYSTTDEIDEETISMDIYYNIKNPKEVLDAGWNFESLIPIFFGILIVFIGLYYRDVFAIGPDSFASGKKKKTGDWDKKFYELKERLENGIIPLFGVLSFIAFGIYLVANKRGWWAWVFIVVGCIAAAYFLIDVIPALSEFIVLMRIKKYKEKSLSVDDDFEKFEKKLKDQENIRKSDKKNKKDDGLDFEIEETIEIKSLKTSGKKKGKK